MQYDMPLDLHMPWSLCLPWKIFVPFKTWLLLKKLITSWVLGKDTFKISTKSAVLSLKMCYKETFLYILIIFTGSLDWLQLILIHRRVLFTIAIGRLIMIYSDHVLMVVSSQLAKQMKFIQFQLSYKLSSISQSVSGNMDRVAIGDWLIG